MDSSQYVRRVLERLSRRRPERVARRASRTARLPCSYSPGCAVAVVEKRWCWLRRRLERPVEAAPLSVIRSLAYFSPVIDEVLSLRVDDAYFRHLRQRWPASFSNRPSSAPFTPAAWMMSSLPSTSSDSPPIGADDDPCPADFPLFQVQLLDVATLSEHRWSTSRKRRSSWDKRRNRGRDRHIQRVIETEQRTDVGSV